MKKICTVFIFLICIFAGIAVGTLNDPETAYADSENELKDEISKSLSELIGSDAEDFFNNLDADGKAEFGATLKEFLSKIIDGKTFDSTLFFNLISEALRKNFFSVTGGLAAIIILGILYGLSKNLNSGFMKESTGQIVYYAIYGSIIATLLVMVNGAIMSAKTVISTIKGLVDVSFPILITVLTALGGTTSAAVFQPLTLVFTKIITEVVDKAIMPMFYATIVFSVIGNLTDTVKLDKLTKGIKSVAGWSLGIMFGVMTALVTAEGLVGASIDNVGIRSAKFALSSYVPILGGYLSDGFDIVMASAVLIKNALGLAGVIILFMIIIAPTIKILLFSIGLKLTAGIIEPMSDTRIPSLLYSVSKSLNILISIVLGMAFLVFIMFMMVISACNLGF